jgi:hypothetical protein
MTHLQRRLRVSAHLRTYETHALKEAVGATYDTSAAAPQSQCLFEDV